jgi:hypothetical protein
LIAAYSYGIALRQGDQSERGTTASTENAGAGPKHAFQSVTAAGAIFVIVVSVRHELFLFVEGPLVGPDEREIDEAHDLFPPKGP